MFQQIIIVGNLGKDPEMRFTNEGRPVTDFTVAVNRRWTTRDGQTGEKTWWFRVSCWGQLAETTNQYLKKGRQVMVIGEVDASAWLGQDGQPRASLEITARDVRFLGGRGDADEMGAGASSSGPGFPRDEEDIPF
ncbi:MAG: hypothetical protein Kow00124_02360 [Anaerolineae bacterium]